MKPLQRQSESRTLRRSRCARDGFTLLEILLVTVLSAVLMVGLWSLFGTYIRLFDSGPKRTERAQLLRAIKQQLTDDLQAAIHYAQPEQSSNNTMTFGTTTSAATSSTIDPSDQDESTAESPSFTIAPSTSMDLPHFGLVGSRQSLTLYVLQSVATVAEPVTEEGGYERSFAATVPTVPELRRVTYTFTEHRPTSPGERQPPPGLIRRELDWQAVQAEKLLSGEGESPLGDLADSGWTEEDLAADDSLAWIPEVTDIRFRYLSRGQWYEFWDSAAQKTLPAAVEVVMILGTPTDPEEETEESLLEEEPTVEIGDEESLSGSPQANSREPRYRFLIHLLCANESSDAGIQPSTLEDLPGGEL